MPLTQEPGRLMSAVAPDGERFISQRADGSLWLASVSGQPSTRLPFALKPFQIFRSWTDRAHEVFLVTLRAERWIVERLDLRTGRVTPHTEIMRDRFADLAFRASIQLARDGRVIAYSQSVIRSDLYLIDGIH